MKRQTKPARHTPAFRWLRCAMPIFVLAWANPAAASGPADQVWARLRQDDLRLAGLVDRLATANVVLCRARAPGTGLVVHSLDQYAPDDRAAAAAAFGFAAPIGVEGVVPGSPAAAADVRADDALLAVNGTALDAAPPPRHANTIRRDAALALIEAAPPDAPLRLALLRQGVAISRTVQPRPACRVRAELVLDDASVAHADDRLLQISSALLDRFDDTALVVVVAHELAHIVLEHGAKRVAAGVRHGWAGEFGRSARLTREAEDEADRFSVRLLANAGYDPAIAVRFWQGPGRALDMGLLRGATHASPAARAHNIAAAIAALPKAAGASIP